MTFKLNLTSKTRKKLESIFENAVKRGDIRTTKRIRAIWAFVDGCDYKTIANFLNVSVESIRIWVNRFIISGPKALDAKKIPGRPPKLTKSQRKELEKLICDGPQNNGFPGACWRTPMIQELILEKFNIFYSVWHIRKILHNMGFTYQKAKFDSAHIKPEEREKWLKEIWPEILKLAKKKNAYIMFGDEASFPQWGSLTYTWAKKGKQPIVKTSGRRKSYKVFGVIEYFSGRFFSKAHEGKLNSESYALFLKSVLSKTRKHIILVQDGAPYHKSKAMKQFFEQHSQRLTVYRLPSYSPKYNPIEMLWKKIKEKEIHLHYFPTFEDLIKRVDEAVLNFENMQNEIISLFGFYNKIEQNLSCE